MSFLSPLALLGLLFVPVVVAMYLLKLRREQRIVPSTLLWQRLLTDVEANAPWQRLRRSLLLLLQLLLVALLAILAARPFIERPAGLAGDVVVVIDTSASMGATDLPPDRLAEAKSKVLERLHDLPANGTVSVIAAGHTARVVVNGTTDIGRVRAAIEAITVSPATGDLGDALNLANALAARAGDAEILVATDAALAIKPTARLEHKVSVIQVGRERKNQAIVALAVRPAPSGVTRSVFVSIANLDIEPARRAVQLWVDGVLREAREPMTLDPQTRTEVIVDDVPRTASVIEVRLVNEAGKDGGDSLAVDDRAWAVVPPDRLRRVLLVGPGDPYLETALTYLPNTELYGVTPDKYGPDTHPELFDLIIFEGFLPPQLPSAAVLAIGPPATSDLGEVIGTLTDPGIATLPTDDPVLKYVDLSSVHIGKATKMALPAWARSVIPGPAGAPLLYTGEHGGRRAAVMAFLPRNSDLPLQVAFPVLMSNLAGELLGGSAAPTQALSPGDPITIPVPAGATSIKVTRPDGSVVELAPATVDAPTVAFSQTDLLGVYTATPVRPAATPGPSGGASLAPIATATPPASAPPASTSPASLAPGATATPVPTAPPTDPNAPVRFAVDLFDPSESDIAPGSPSTITSLGRQSAAPATPGPSAGASPAGSPAPSAAGGGGGGTEERPAARDELWVVVVLVVLAVLLVEWLVYHRDTVTRLWRGVRRGPSEAAPGTKAGR